MACKVPVCDEYDTKIYMIIKIKFLENETVPFFSDKMPRVSHDAKG
jgi:hypothetical protein